MSNSPESGPSESGTGTAQPNWGAIPTSAAQTVGAVAIGGYVAGQAGTAAAIGSTAVSGAQK